MKFTSGHIAVHTAIHTAIYTAIHTAIHTWADLLIFRRDLDTWSTTAPQHTPQHTLQHLLTHATHCNTLQHTTGYVNFLAKGNGCGDFEFYDVTSINSLLHCIALLYFSINCVLIVSKSGLRLINCRFQIIPQSGWSNPCSVLHCLAMSCSALQCLAVSCSVLRGVLQCVAENQLI